MKNHNLQGEVESEYGIISSFYHVDSNTYGGSETHPDRLPSHNRYFYDVWLDFLDEQVGSDTPVVVVNNSSPVHPSNFFFHRPNLRISENPRTMPHGSVTAHRHNCKSALREGFLALRDLGIKYAAHLEQDVLVNKRGWLSDSVDMMKAEGADIMRFKLHDLGWFATELFVTRVDYWLDNDLLNNEASDRATIGHPTEVTLERQLNDLDAKILNWNDMESSRDSHPDPLGVNGYKYVHHRHPEELFEFFDQCEVKSANIQRLRRFISERCLSSHSSLPASAPGSTASWRSWATGLLLRRG